MGFFKKIGKAFKKAAGFAGDLLTGGAFSAAKAQKKAAKDALAREEDLRKKQLLQRQAASRASLVGAGGAGGGSLFDLLSRPS